MNALVRLIGDCGVSRDEALLLELEQVVESYNPLCVRRVIHIHERQADRRLGLKAGPVALTYATEVWLERYLKQRAQRGWLPSSGPLFIGSTRQGRRRGHALLSGRTARRDWAHFLGQARWSLSERYPWPYRPFDLEDLRLDGIVQCEGGPERKAIYARCSKEAIEGLLPARPAAFMPPPPNAGERPATPVHQLSIEPARWAVYLMRKVDERYEEHQLDRVGAWVDGLDGKTQAERERQRTESTPRRVVRCYVERTPIGSPSCGSAWTQLLADAATLGFQGVVIWDYSDLGRDAETIARRILDALRAGVVVRSYVRRNPGAHDPKQVPFPADVLSTEALELVSGAFYGWERAGHA